MTATDDLDLQEVKLDDIASDREEVNPPDNKIKMDSSEEEEDGKEAEKKKEPVPQVSLFRLVS